MTKSNDRKKCSDKYMKILGGALLMKILGGALLRQILEIPCNAILKLLC